MTNILQTLIIGLCILFSYLLIFSNKLNDANLFMMKTRITELLMLGLIALAILNK